MDNLEITASAFSTNISHQIRQFSNQRQAKAIDERQINFLCLPLHSDYENLK